MKEKKYPSIARYKYYSLFGTPVKQLVMQFFALHGDKEYSLQKLWENTNIPSSSLSPALVELRDVGLLESRKEGKNVFYSLNKEFAKIFSQVYDRLDKVYELTFKKENTKKGRIRMI